MPSEDAAPPGAMLLSSRPRTTLFDPLAQAMDVHVNPVVAHLLAPFAQALNQLALADRPPGAL
jgi:hypothetical protein